MTFITMTEKKTTMKYKLFKNVNLLKKSEIMI